MPSNAQNQAIVALYALGRTNQQIATAVGVELGDVESVVGGGTFNPPGVPLSGGGSPAGAHITHKFPFAFDTPNLRTGIVAAFTDGYSPAIDDLLIDAWIEIDTAWDGTAPFGDFGTTFDDGAGFFGNQFGPLDMTVPDIASSAGSSNALGNHSVLDGQTARTLSLYTTLCGLVNGLLAVNGNVLVQGPPGNPFPPHRTYGVLPWKFLTADPLKVVVSQNGSITGADPGSTQGAATLYVTTATL